ncbi:Dynein heavy chain family protein [Tritrichomonas foetus]|uniref:Dynein heavy chain family protein n=1 Tax=Tritrichomonas foetus TaxID=1144522 RepID=A0A1J4JG86_9EUKA|nr:Dynein heavy chain family protein [Tritrichomonas foetus]|eukprot:OHS96659.1 Dynein heavy chain family protein [Tritrichomonas foetus]
MQKKKKKKKKKKNVLSGPISRIGFCSNSIEYFMRQKNSFEFLSFFSIQFFKIFQMDEKESEIRKFNSIPTPQVISHRPKQNSAVIMENRSLYNATEVGNRADDYDIQKENESESDLIIRTQNPGLLAFRNQKAKNKAKNRPMSNIVLAPLQGNSSSSTNTTFSSTATSQTTHFSSLINPKPQSSLLKKTLSPMQITKREIEEERNSLAFKEDPIAYFSKRKDGSGHLFITLNFARDRSDPEFSPYELVKAPTAELNPEYFTMSASGVTHIFPNGESDHATLERWAAETAFYKMIRALRIFALYRYWKSFKVWKNFIKRRRYEKMSLIVKAHPFFVQTGFYMTTLNVMETSCEQMVKQYLLSFWPQRKFTMKMFLTEIEENKEALIEEYQNYLSNVLELMLQLDGDIRDPTRVLVKETDFTRGKNVIPNLGQLMVIREKVDAERIKRNEIVNNEVKGFCYFIRMIDYLLLESLSTACYESWKAADQNVSQEMSSIFQIEIYFTDEGEIAFVPTLDELLTAIDNSLSDSIITLTKLPRLLSQSQLRPHLREVYNSIHKLLEDGPHFDQFCKTNPDYEKFHDNIIRVIKDSYHESEEHSRGFIEFFPLYKIGKEWSPQIYIMQRGGESHKFDLATSRHNVDSSSSIDLENDEESLSFDPSTELIVDFDAVRKDINDFLSYETRLTQFHACTVRGALYIDSKNLRGILTPIPIQSIRAIQNALKELIQKKIDDITRIFRFCSKKLKKDPGTLEQYVDHCEFTAKVQAMDPFISKEIDFVDKLYALYENVGYNSNNLVDHSRNPLRDGYRTFQNDQDRAIMIRKLNSDRFVQILNDKLKQKESKLQKYHVFLQTFPTTIEEANMDFLIPQIEKAKEKLVKLEPDIHALMKCQEVMGVKLHDLNEYDVVQRGATFADKLFKSIHAYNKISFNITNVPFNNINIDEFCKEVLRLRDEANELIKTSDRPNGMLDEMYEKLSRIIPFLDQLKVLSESQMHFRHWNSLFNQCGQANTYYAQIKIDELISLGILNETEKIKTIASTAKGESQLETDFQAVTARWQEVKLPLLESQPKAEDSLLLGDLNSLFQEIYDTQITLNQMLLFPYVQGIKDSILQFSNSLESYAKIMDAWSTFESNWVILSPFFSQDATKEILPHQANRFTMVKRRWVSLVRHTLENTSLVHVCSFPSLHEMLIENNKTMQNLLQSVTKFIDVKRTIMPRFYFLSDAEILKLFSTLDFNIFQQYLRKIFMKVRAFKTQSQEENNQTNGVNKLQEFSRLRILGLMGDGKNFLKFVKNVQCIGSIENWINNLVETMKISLRESVSNALTSFTQTPLKSWIKAYSTSVCLLVFQIKYATEIDECFNNFENNVHSFTEYQKKLIEIQATLSNLLHDDDFIDLNDQISSLIMTIDTHIHMTSILSERIQNFSQNLNWSHYFKLRLIDEKLYIEFDSIKVEHGYEFYGSSPLFIQSQASLRAKNNICHSLNAGCFPYLFGSAHVGKKSLLTHLTSLYGQFLYIFPAFTDTNKTILSRIFSGVAANGCWLAFNDLRFHSPENLVFIYDTLREFQSPKIEGKVIIDGSPKVYLKNARIIFTGHSLLRSEKSFPPQLRSALKPVSLGAPNIEKMALAKFSASGFFEGESISGKLINLLRSITYIFSYLPVKTILSTTMKIINEAKATLLFISHNNTIPFLTYYESPALAEEYSVVYAIYKWYIHCIRTEHQQSFLQLIYSYFPMFSSFDKFKRNLTDHDCFVSDTCEKILKDTLHLLITNTSDELADYLIERTVSFYNLLIRNPCVIIYGPPNSGKSQIVDLLESAINKILESPEKAEFFTDLRPIKLFDVYHNIETWERMFGEMKFDNDLGQIWNCGEMQTYVTNLMKYENTHQRILRLNGPLTPRFVNFITQMAGSAENGSFKLNTLDSLEYDNNMHIIFETDNIASLTPSCFGFCGILPMTNEHTRLVCPTNLDLFEFVDPLQILNRVLSVYRDHVPEIMKRHIIKLFPEISASIIKYVYKTPNYLYHSDSQMRTQDSEVIIAEHLPYLALLYMFNYLDIAAADKSNEEHIRVVMVMSLFTVFSSIIENTNLAEFDNWVRAQFQLKVPQDWVGFEVSQRFWDTYPRPSMMSLRFYENDLLPLKEDFINMSPLTSPNVALAGLPILSTVSICTVSYLPLINQGEILLRQKQHFMLYGPAGCGKSTLLKFIFRNSQDIIPMVIPVSKWSTKHSLQQFILTHSNILQKQYMLATEMKTHALIFDNLPPNNMKAIEFIRMLVTSSFVPVTSRKDPKYLDMLQMKNYFVIVTSRSLSNFPPRFLAKFFLMKLDEPSNISIREIYNGLGKHFNINQRLVDITYSLTEKFRNTDTRCGFKKTPFHYLSLLNVFPAFEKREGNSNVDMAQLAKLLLCQLNLYYTHRLVSKDSLSSVQRHFEMLFDIPECKSLFKTFFKGEDIMYAETENRNRSFCVNVSNHPTHLIQEELNFYLAGFNGSHSDKLIIKFTPPVIRQWAMLQNALTFPGSNVLLIGKENTGRYTLTRFVAHMKEQQFIYVPPQSDIDINDVHERRLFMNKLLSKTLRNIAINPKPLIIFIKYNRHSMMDIEMLSHLYELGDPTPFLKSNEIEELYYMNGTKHGIPQDDRLTMFDQICEILKLNVHIAMSVNENFNAEKYPLFTKIEFLSSTSKFIKKSSKTIFSHPRLEKMRSLFPENITHVLYLIHEAARNKYKQVSVNSFYDFADNFIHYYQLWHEEALNRRNNGNIAISFIESLHKEIEDIEKQINEGKPDLMKQKVEDDKIQQSFIIKKDTIQVRLNKIDDEERKHSMELKTILDEIGPLKAQLNDAGVHVDLAKNKLDALSQTSLNSLLPYIDDPPPVFKYVMDLTCSMMDQPQSFGKKLFKDEKLIQIILSRINPLKMDESTIKRAYTISERNKFDSRDANSVCPTLTPFYDWANAAIKVAVLAFTIKEKEILYEHKKKVFHQYKEDVKLERESIQQVSDSLEKEIAEFQIGYDKLKEQENDFEYLEEKQSTLKNITDGLNSLLEKWKNYDAGFKDIEFKIIGDALTFSSFITYTGMISNRFNDNQNNPRFDINFSNTNSNKNSISHISPKNDFFKEVHDILLTNGFTDSLDDPLFIKKTLAIMNENNEDFFFRNDNPAFMFTDHNVQFVESVIRTPLIIDPDGLINETITKSIKPKKLCRASMYSHKLYEIFVHCLTEGKTLILEDVDWLHPILLSILPMELYPSKENSEVTIEINTFSKYNFYQNNSSNNTKSKSNIENGGDNNQAQKIIRNHKFRLFLFSSKLSAKDIPAELASRVTVIDLSYDSLNAVRDIITNVFIQSYLPGLSKKYNSDERMLLHQIIQKHKFEKEILEIISEVMNNQKNDKDYDFLDDEELILNFFQSKDCYFNADKEYSRLLDMKSQISSNSKQEDVVKPIEKFKPLIDICFIFWEALSRFLPKVKTGKAYSLNDFIASIHAAINACNFKEGEELNDQQLDELQRSIISHIFDFIMPTLMFNEIYFLLFYVTFRIRVLKKINPESDFPNIVTHLTQEYNGTFDMKVIEIRTGDTIDQLRFSSIGSVFQIITKFITEEFGKNFLGKFPMFSLESFSSAPSYTPILIKMSERDPGLLFDEFANSRNKLRFMFSISLSDDEKSLKKAEAKVQKAIENGFWVIVHYHVAKPIIAAFLNDITDQIKNAPAEFRLVILCRSTKFLPHSLLVRCKKIEYESFPSIKQQMLEIYQHYGQLLTNHKFCPNIKRLFYMEALTYSLIRYRMFVDPIGFFYNLPLDEPNIKDIFNGSIITYENQESVENNNIVEQNKNKKIVVSPLNVLRKFILGLFFSGMCTDDFDLQKVNLYLELDAEKGFTHESSLEKSIWEVPSFSVTSTANKFIQKLPHFPNGDVLLMDKEISSPLIQWNLSRWITKPFIKLNRLSVQRPPIEQIRIQLESLKALFPPDVDVSLTPKNSTPMSLFLLCEVEKLNSSIMKIREEIHYALEGLREDVIQEISLDQVPQRWCEIVGFNGSRIIARFFTFIREKADFLAHWMKNGTYITQAINVNHIRNIKGLLLAFLNEMAYQRRSQITTNEFICIIDSNKGTYSGRSDGIGPGLTLTNVWLVGGNYDQQLCCFVEPNAKTLPMKRFQEILFIPKSFCPEESINANELEGYNDNIYECPFYLSFPCQQFALEEEKSRTDGETNNLICTLKLKTRVPVENLVSNGVCLVCHLPEIFTP